MRDVFVVGVGMTEFGKHPELSLRDLGRQACRAAIEDAGVKPDEIEAGYCGNALASVLQQTTSVGQSVFWEVGIHKIPVVNIENACASGSTALHEAWKSVAGGFCDVAIVLGVEKSVMPKGTALNVGTASLEAQLGDIFPGNFAMMAARHMEEFGTTREQMAQVSVKNHISGALNPYAQFQKILSVEEVLASPMIADPLTLYSCCPNSDGAAALVICSADFASRATSKAIKIAASVLTTGGYDNQRDLTGWEAERSAAAQAYEIAGLGPEDIDCAEVHDAFTICEIVHYEGLGFCPPGEGGRLIDQGVTALGGALPVNPSGGLLSKGHPVGASGVAQIVELTWQLRNEAGKRQVADSRVALAQIMGGSQQGDVCACTVHILVNEQMPAASCLS
ncbi:MAG: thiolase family protein [Alphaproteobacteria bacterium]|jgi:acetyl-CoA acetyltransferase|nr:thiolase family protein [Alphaproteobacteria bacterium]MBT5161569.1 thiolase family protein [Alphaproteobacteria bacterium]